jgi:ribonuclease J
MVEICAIGGYGEVGKNMTAIKYQNEVVILDMGLHLPNYVKYTEEEREHMVALNATDLKRVKAIPNDNIIKKWKDMVVAIAPSHAHLDHIGAIPYLAPQYDCPVYGTPFTMAVIKEILHDQKMRIPNKIIPVNLNSKVKVSKNITLEFINVTHSTPHSSIIAVHTPDGVILYTNDFKLDNNPTLGKKTNYKRLKELGKIGVTAVILDSLYAHTQGKTPSESVAKQMLKDVLLDLDSEGRAVIVTTFSSQIARLKSIVEFGKKMDRKIIFMGRSLAKYLSAAKKVGVADLGSEGTVCRYGRQVRQKLKEVEKQPHKYLLITTGHQGEPRAILSRMANKELPFAFRQQDHIIFSCQVIPTPITIKSRAKLEKQLQKHGVRIFKDIHASGHGRIEELRELITLTKPKHLIPGHSEPSRFDPFVRLARQMKYKKDKSVHLMKNTDCIQLFK